MISSVALSIVEDGRKFSKLPMRENATERAL